MEKKITREWQIIPESRRVQGRKIPQNTVATMRKHFFLETEQETVEWRSPAFSGEV